MKLKAKSFMISLLMAVLMLVAFAFGLTFMPTTAHAETSNLEINVINVGFNPAIGSKRLTANEVFFNDGNDTTLEDNHARLQISNIVWRKDTAFGQEMGENEVYALNSTYYLSLNISIKEEYLENTTFGSTVTNRVNGPIEAVTTIEVMQTSATELSVRMQVVPTAPKVELSITNFEANGTNIIGNVLVETLNAQGYYHLDSVSWQKGAGFDASLPVLSNSVVIENSLYVAKVFVEIDTVKISQYSLVEISGVENYTIKDIQASNNQAIIFLTVDTRIPATIIESVNVTVDAPVVGESPAVPVVTNENAELLSYYWRLNDGSTLSSSDTFLRGEYYILEVSVQAKTGYEFKDSNVVTINGENTDFVIGTNLTTNIVKYNFPVCGTDIDNITIEMDAPEAGEVIYDMTEPDCATLTSSRWNYKTAHIDLTSGAKFAGGVYSYRFTLELKNPYLFIGTEQPTITVGGKKATIASFNETTVQAYVDFEIKCIDSLNILISKPVNGRAPSTVVIGEENDKIEAATISWLSSPETFVTGEEYTLICFIQPINGYSFPAFYSAGQATDFIANVKINNETIDSTVISGFDTTGGYKTKLTIMYTLTAIPEHTHIYGNTFNGHNDTHHWKECTDNECPDKFESRIELAEHAGGTATCQEKATCQYCNIAYGDKDMSNHTSTDFTYITNNDGTHKKVYKCCDTTANANEVCTGGTKTCTTKATCEKCETAYGDTLTHTPKVEWENNETHHWHDCTGCSGQELEKTTHTPDRAQATETEPIKCTECGYTITPALGHTTHTPKVEWENNDSHHWHDCTGCEGQELEKAQHVDSDNNGKCDTCEYDMPTTPPDSGSETPDSGSETPEKPDEPKDGLGIGAIIGIVVGGIAVVGIGGFALVWFVIKKKTWADFIAIFKKN